MWRVGSEENRASSFDDRLKTNKAVGTIDRVSPLPGVVSVESMNISLPLLLAGE